MTISFRASTNFAGPAVVIGLDGEGAPLSDGLPSVLGDALTAAVRIQRGCGRFFGNLGDIVEILAPTGPGCQRLICICVGRSEALDDLDLQRLGGLAAQALMAAGESEAILALAPDRGWSAQIAYGAHLRNYRFTCGRSRPSTAADPVRVARIEVVDADPVRAAAEYAELAPIADATRFARDLVNEPPNLLFPASFVERVRALGVEGLELDVLGPDRLRDLGMNAMLAVGGGSVHAPQLLTLRWNGAPNPADAPLALVGKGVTFDTGGVVLKTLDSMKGMKGDMAGGAAVVAALIAAASLKSPINIVGVVGLAENAISGSAYRPSDVIVTGCGVSIEVTHTDAEGRLVLMDALWYARAHLKAAKMVGIGTVTGSGLFGLGRRYAGLYTASDDLAQDLLGAGAEVGERLWRLPFDEEYDGDLISDIADYRQQAPFLHGGDGSYVARLLRHAAGDTPWAQVEMCGLEFCERDTAAAPKGATGFGVRLLQRFAASPAVPDGRR